MSSLQPIDDRMREAQYGRFATNILRVLREAVDRRVEEGETRTSLAEKLGWNRSQLSRLLNGNVGNITIKSISDILWVARFEPEDFEALAHEDISPNYVEVRIEAPQHATMGGSIKVQAATVVTSNGNVANIEFIGGGSSQGQQSRVWIAS